MRSPNREEKTRGQLGSSQLGSSQLGSSQLGSSQLGSSQLGSSQLGSSQLGSSQLGSSQLGSSQLGSRASKSSTWKLGFQVLNLGGFLRTAVVMFALALPATSFAASLSLSPASGSYRVGDKITVRVLVSSPSESINAVSGELSFSPSVLSVESVSKAGSILNFWPIEPLASQKAGTVNFEGVAISGFQGSAGVVVSVTFRAARAGSGTVVFDNGQVLANDGQGTDITTGLAGAAFHVSPASESPTASVEEVVITSPTHPDQTKWYKATETELAWKNPEGSTAVRIGYDKFSTGVPTVVYDPLISQKTLSLKEGVWYFHLQEKNANGWGPVSTFRIRVDTTPPRAFNIEFPRGASTGAPPPLALFTTTDALSGVDYYELVIKGSSPLRIASDDIASGHYPLPVQEPGAGSVKVTAYDKAGNSASDQADFEVIGLDPPELNPIEDITEGEAFFISGATYPDAHVDVSARSANGQVSSQGAESDLVGTFRLTWKEYLPAGVYAVTAKTTDKTGAKSTPSPEVTFQIEEAAPFAIGRLVLNYLSLALVALAVVGVLSFCGWYLWQHFWRFRKRVLSRITQAEASLHSQFDELKNAISEEVSALEHMKSKRNLTVEEERLINRFKKMLDKSERLIEKEISDIVK